MMMLASGTIRLPSSSTGKRPIGQSSANSAMTSGFSGASRRSSKGVAFSYSATSTFWQ